jgi:DnaJ-class molecular chaperone
MGSLILLFAVFFGGYLISLRIHPLRKCPVCKMTGRHFGSVFTNSYRRCRNCEGTGRRDRWGTQVFFGGTGHTGIYKK